MHKQTDVESSAGVAPRPVVPPGLVLTKPLEGLKTTAQLCATQFQGRAQADAAGKLVFLVAAVPAAVEHTVGRYGIQPTPCTKPTVTRWSPE